jgi:hypothetical protein
VSAGAALTDLNSKLALAGANLLMISVNDREGVSNEVFRALAAADVPHKLLTEKGERSAMFVRMENGAVNPADLLSSNRESNISEVSLFCSPL